MGEDLALERAEESFYSAVLRALERRKDSDKREEFSEFHGTIQISREEIEKIFVFDTDIEMFLIRQAFNDDGNAQPWMLVVTGKGDIREYTD